MSQLDRASVLITGGTGSLGKSLVSYLLNETKVRRIAIFSRDELKQHDLRIHFKDDPRLRWFLGDVRDLERLKRALHGVDFVIHTAALKQVDTGEYNPMEFIKTNVLGSQNVIDASIYAGVKRVVALSTDKASSPINLYGATKLTADKLFVAANNYSFTYGTTFSVVRYGNVMGSRGSVIPFFKDLAAQGKPLPITDLRMTRFWITLDEAVKFVLNAFKISNPGEILVPKIPSIKIVDLVKAINSKGKIKVVGIRPGEKLHELLISDSENNVTREEKNYYIVQPSFMNMKKISGSKKVSDGFAYSSLTNKKFLSVKKIKKLIKKNNSNV